MYAVAEGVDGAGDVVDPASAFFRLTLLVVGLLFQGFDEVTAFVVDAEAVGEEEDVNAVDAVGYCGIGKLVLDGKAAFAEDGEVGGTGVRAGALAGGSVGDDHDVAAFGVSWV